MVVRTRKMTFHKGMAVVSRGAFKRLLWLLNALLNDRARTIRIAG